MIFKDQRILVTGGTGSMGKTFVRRVLSGELGIPKKIIIFSRDEAKQHQMRLDYLHCGPKTEEIIYKNFLNTLEFRIGDVRNYDDVVSAVRDADYVINAAAMKQVPTCEYFPFQAIETNCRGAENIVKAVRIYGEHVKKVVCISTDKAAKPVNVMGMSKAIQEKIFISANVLNKKTSFVAVRYGNVLASRGSVIPMFHDQIKNGGPVTITDTRMTRFLLTLDQAVDTVFTALKEARPGETYVPRAPSARMENIVKALIGDRNIEVSITGIRPGEKLHEIMVSEEEYSRADKRGAYLAILPMLPELLCEASSAESFLQKEYSSNDETLDLEGTKKLLFDNQLLFGQAGDFSTNEFFR